jgi:hypothetical protein
MRSDRIFLFLFHLWQKISESLAFLRNSPPIKAEINAIISKLIQ